MEKKILIVDETCKFNENVCEMNCSMQQEVFYFLHLLTYMKIYRGNDAAIFQSSNGDGEIVSTKWVY